MALKTSHRGLLLGAVLLIVIGVPLGFALARKGGVAVSVTVVRPRVVHATVLASGTLEYRHQVELQPQVIGEVVSIPVHEGERVHRGQIVLRLDPRTYRAQVRRYQAEVHMQRLSITEARLNLANLERTWRRDRAIYHRGLLAAQAYDNARNSYEEARLTLASEEQSLHVAEAELEAAQEQLALTVVRSPINGVVALLNVKRGETVISGTTNIVGSQLMTIGDPHAVLARAMVDEADIARVRKGERARVVAVAYPGHPFVGRVVFVATSATPIPGQTGNGFEVKILLQHTRGYRLDPGLDCRVSIDVASSGSLLTVPVAAVLYTPPDHAVRHIDAVGKPYVYLDVGGRARRTPVRLGIANDTWQSVLAGLRAGERVVSGPYRALHELYPGARLRLVPALTRLPAKDL
jgi:HlyD family secretion protein